MAYGRRRRWALVALIAQTSAFSDIKRARDLKPIIREDSPSSDPVIQFVPGVDETVIPEVSMTRSATSQRDGKFFTGTATFWFDKADALFRDITADSLITGMRLCDEEGVVETADVKAEFRRGNPAGITAVLVLSSPDEWNRFMRFMTRFADQSGLAFTAAQGMRGTEGAGGS